MNNLVIRTSIFIILPLLTVLAFAAGTTKEHEAFYNRVWCESKNGQEEVILDGGLRVDCLTDQFAVETDRAFKWYESIGQALLYAETTGKDPAVLLILYGDNRDCTYIERLFDATNTLNIRKFFTGDMGDEQAFALAAQCLINRGM